MERTVQWIQNQVLIQEERRINLPALHLVMVHEHKRGNRNPILVLNKELANRSETVEALDDAVGEGAESTVENRVAGEEAEDAVEHDGGLGVGGGELGGEVGRRHVGGWPGPGDGLEEVELDDRLQDHG